MCCSNEGKRACTNLYLCCLYCCYSMVCTCAVYRTGDSALPIVYCTLVEQCYQKAQMGGVVYCRTHDELGPFWVIDKRGVVSIGHAAPDSVSSFSIGCLYCKLNSYWFIHSD